VQDLGHLQRDRGLAGARAAGERHVQRRPRGLQPRLLAQALDDQQRRDLADAPLDGRQGDELVVETREQLAHARLVRGPCSGDGHARAIV